MQESPCWQPGRAEVCRSFIACKENNAKINGAALPRQKQWSQAPGEAAPTPNKNGAAPMPEIDEASPTHNDNGAMPQV